MGMMQTALKLIYPDQCVTCGALVEGSHGLCGGCWRETPFVSGLSCDLCSHPLIGDRDDEVAICDDCLTSQRPWTRGRAAFLYTGGGRRIVMALKHSDRTDLVAPAARWMAEAGRDLLQDAPVLVPIPLHWRRLVSRRYNQSAELARAIGRVAGVEVWPDALRRTRATTAQQDMTAEERHRNLAGAISARAAFGGRSVVLIDDVMTSGATFAAATDAALAGGAGRVCVLMLARAAKNP